MKHETAQAKAKEIAERTLAPNARQNDKEGRFSTEAVDALYYWRLVAKNGEAIGRSETYATKSNATRGVSDIVTLLGTEPKVLAN